MPTKKSSKTTLQQLKSSNIFRNFAVDATKADGGVWFDLGDDVRVLVARMGNPKFQAALYKLYAETTAARELLTATNKKQELDELSQKLTQKAIARGVLLDWEGVYDDDGESLPYSVALGEAMLTDPDLQEFTEKVMTLASFNDNYRHTKVKEAVKN